MNILKKIFLLIIINFSISSFSQGWDNNGPGTNPGTGTGAPGTQYYEPPPTPCATVPDEGGWETNGCNEPPTTGAPGTHVPIDDYIPLLALTAIAIGGITFYRRQKQIIKN